MEVLSLENIQKSLKESLKKSLKKSLQKSLSGRSLVVGLKLVK